MSLFRKDGTAQGVAKQRCIETEAPPDKQVVTDPYAALFVKGSSIIKCLGHNTNMWLCDKIVPGMHEHLIARTRAIDELVKDKAANGATQYLILGAGYDMRAYRLELPSSLKVFEVDQQEVQDIKKSKIPSDLLASSSTAYVSVDFNTQTVTEQVTKAGFQTGQPTIVTLEGVTQYVPKEAIAATLKEVGALCGPGSTIFVSYGVDAIETDPPAICGQGYPNPEGKVQTLMKLASAVGEPWIAFYRPDEIKAVLSSCGFQVTSDTCFEDVNEKYFGSVGRKQPPEKTMNLERFAVATSV
jgi:methyltransferase (TIGR00027 family)